MGNTQAFLNKKIFSILLYFLFLACLLPIAIFSFKNPANNWDMLGYMAIIIRMDGTKDIKEVHRIVYKNASDNIPQRDFQKLVDTSGPRARFAADPHYFEKVLPIYIVKPLYTWLVYLSYKAGLNLPAATVFPSLIAYFLIGLLLFHWLNKYLKPVIAFLTALLIMTSVFMVASANLSSPDLLSAFFLFSAAYFILEKPDIRLAFLFLLLSILTRADNAITSFFIISLLSFSNKWARKITKVQYFLMVFILVGAYFVAICQVRQFGWSLFYYSQYIKHMDFNRDLDKAFTLADYFSYMYSKAITGLISSHFTFFMLLSSLIIFIPFPTRPKNLSFDQLFVLLLVLTILVRFVLLPDLSDRFYIGFYLVILVLLIRKLVGKYPGKKPWENNIILNTGG
jgi:hypothetical protein